MNKTTLSGPLNWYSDILGLRLRLDIQTWEIPLTTRFQNWDLENSSLRLSLGLGLKTETWKLSLGLGLQIETLKGEK